MPLLFVYGTLRYGSFNNWRLSNDTYVGKITTATDFYMVMVRSRSQPFISRQQILPDTKPCRIVGELYDVSPTTLTYLDRMEGHPDRYTRQRILLEDGVKAEAYLLETGELLAEIRDSGGRFVAVEGGDFLAGGD